MEEFEQALIEISKLNAEHKIGMTEEEIIAAVMYADRLE